MRQVSDRLNRRRDVYYAGDTSLGQRTMAVSRQSADPRYAEYRENVRWSLGPALFATINIPGSNNNLDRTDEMDAEYRARNEPNLSWMAESFALARQEGYRGVMLIVHANPGFEIKPRISGYVEGEHRRVLAEGTGHLGDGPAPLGAVQRGVEGA